MILKRIRPLTLLMFPLFGMTIFCAAQGGLQMVRPDGLQLRITPRTTADYRPWPVDHFQPVDPALSTVVAEDGHPTPVIVNTPNPNVAPAAVDLPTTDPNAKVPPTRTLVLAPPVSQPSATPAPTDTPEPTYTLSPEQLADLTGTPTDTSDPNSSGKPKPTKKPRAKPTAKGNGNGNANGGGNGGGKGK